MGRGGYVTDDDDGQMNSESLVRWFNVQVSKQGLSTAQRELWRKLINEMNAWVALPYRSIDDR